MIIDRFKAILSIIWKCICLFVAVVVAALANNQHQSVLNTYTQQPADVIVHVVVTAMPQ